MAKGKQCWKGKRTTKFNSVYINPKTNERVGIVAGYGSSYIVYFKNIAHDKIFDDRKSAIKFAKSYMKKHNKC